MGTSVATVDQYLASLPDGRRAVIEVVRDTVNTHLPAGYQEGIAYGMIGWSVPHSLYPAGYHTDPKQPLPYAALAAQKSHYALYLNGLYIGPAGVSGVTADVAWFRDAWAAAGSQLDMGKSCVRFKRLDDVPLDVVGAAIARIPVTTLIERYEAVRPTGRR